MSNAISSIQHGELMGSTDSKQCPSKTFSWGYLKANPTNTGKVFVGGSSDVSLASNDTDSITTGFPLAADGMLPLEGSGNLNQFWYITENSTDELMYILFTML